VPWSARQLRPDCRDGQRLSGELTGTVQPARLDAAAKRIASPVVDSSVASLIGTAALTLVLIR
jgi:hypothetical protein